MKTTWWHGARWCQYEEWCGLPRGHRADMLRRADWRTRMVDLGQDKETLWRGVRRSYHALINRLTREYGMPGRYRESVHGAEASAIMATLQRAHREAAGRETRPWKTWMAMGDWLEEDRGLVVCAYDYATQRIEELPCVGFVYFIRHGDWSYYASAASLRKDINIALIWWAMLALKEMGVRWCELGWQGEATTEKGQQIEFVRRGFGGVDVPVRETL